MKNTYKICNCCGTKKVTVAFYGKRAICKDCYCLQKKRYYTAHREEYLQRQKTWRNENKLHIARLQKSWRDANSEHIVRYHQIYRVTHKQHRLQYVQDRLRGDLQYKMRHNLRRRFRHALSGGHKAGSAVRDLGCSSDNLKRHLETQFKSGMSWDNYGEWHIDHIKPLVSFDLTKREELLKACHYTNLQPLWKRENLEKGSRP